MTTKVALAEGGGGRICHLSFVHLSFVERFDRFDRIRISVYEEI